MLQVFRNLWNRLSPPKTDLVAFPEIFEHFQDLLRTTSGSWNSLPTWAKNPAGNTSLTAST